MRQFIVRTMARISYWLGVDSVFYILNRSAKRIITFHNVIPDELFVPGLPNGVSNTLSEFRRIVDEFAKRYRFSTDVMDPSTLTITFDDGYLNQYEVAAKELAKRQIPAILFVAGKLIDAEPIGALVVDQLLHWTALAPDWAVEKAFGSAKDRHALWVNVVRPAFCRDVAQKGEGLLRRIDAIYSMKEIRSDLKAAYVRLRLTGVSHEQLEKLRNHGWITGWHTQSHFPLSALPTDEARREIGACEALKGARGKRADEVVFSYPYGELQSVSAESIRLAKERGYPCAVSNSTLPSSLYGLHFLPRMALPADKYLLHFELSGAKHFLKYHRLLSKVIK